MEGAPGSHGLLTGTVLHRRCPACQDDSDASLVGTVQVPGVMEREAPLKVGARHERTLEAVGCRASLCGAFLLEYLLQTCQAADVVSDSGHVWEHRILVDVRNLEKLQGLWNRLAG